VRAMLRHSGRDRWCPGISSGRLAAGGFPGMACILHAPSLARQFSLDVGFVLGAFWICFFLCFFRVVFESSFVKFVDITRLFMAY
jgi:hypothetical protein